MVNLLVILPVATSLFIGADKLTQILVDHTKLVNTCRHLVFSAYDNIAKEIDALLDLNPRARVLRQRRRSAEIRLRQALSSGVVPVIAAAKAHLLTVIFQQTQLAMQQKRHLTQIAIEKNRLRLNGHLKLAKNSPHVKVPALQVRADRSGDIAPVYLKQPNFKAAQTVELSFKILHKRHACYATIETRGTRLNATLVEKQNES